MRLRTTRNCATETLHRRYGLRWEPFPFEISDMRSPAPSPPLPPLTESLIRSFTTVFWLTNSSTRNCLSAPSAR
ncbi:hypothetical protein SBV1_2030010 [Verrucomicrobia bacterium]|nr:hypothetical protein SBV1_2030010 [Verrucomicrobiota bacterium]